MRQQILLNQSSRKLFQLIALLLMSANSIVLAQTSVFTYQGRLTDGGTPANGSYDLQFALFDSAGAGTQIGSTQTVANVSVSAGVFTVQLDFGTAALSGANRFLEISVRLAGGGTFTTLSSRQQITSTPYAVRSANATAADVATNALQLGGVAAAQYTQTNDSRLSNPRAPNPGSSNYVQNTTGQQASTNFNVSGNGTAGGTLKGDVVSAETQYNLSGNRVLSVAGTNNTFAGVNAGQANTDGSENSFFGRGAGFANTSGTGNAFFGYQAGQSDTDGYFNAFFGFQAGQSNTTANDNAFFGDEAGYSNTTGELNAFFGDGAGYSNTTGDFNSFFGSAAGSSNTTGDNNSFFGNAAAGSNTTGHNNTMIGVFTGYTNMTGDSNTIIGFGADVGSSNLNHATAIGADAFVNSSNTIALGRADGSDFVLVPGFLTIPNLAVAGSTQLCRNSFNRVGTCSSSLRYKTDLAPYRSGLSVVNRLHPISFTWRDGGLRDLGFGAEDVEKIDPLLVTYNKEGIVEGVKYDRINVVLVNALKEQQLELDRKDAEIQTLKAENAGMTERVAGMNGRLAAVERVVHKLKTTPAKRRAGQGRRRLSIRRYPARSVSR